MELDGCWWSPWAVVLQLVIVMGPQSVETNR